VRGEQPLFSSTSEMSSSSAASHQGQAASEQFYIRGEVSLNYFAPGMSNSSGFCRGRGSTCAGAPSIERLNGPVDSLACMYLIATSCSI